VAKLGSAVDPYSPAGSLSFGQDAEGRYFVLADDRRSIAVYDEGGKYLTRVGRKGAGPGEFGRAIAGFALGRGDSLFVVDGTRRLSVFDRNLKFARSILLPGAVAGAALLADGSVVLSMSISTSDVAGLSYHLIDPAGKIQRSFGTKRNVTPGSSDASPMPVASIDGKSVWTIDRDFRVRGWSAGGEPLADLVITDHPWGVAPPVPDMRGMGISERARILSEATQALPALVSIAGIDEAGQVWLNVIIQHGRQPDEHFLEVIDPTKREFVTSKKVPRPIVRLVRGRAGLLGAANIDDQGVPAVEVWRLALVRL
jgi:hypothetical protein